MNFIHSFHGPVSEEIVIKSSATILNLLELQEMQTLNLVACNNPKMIVSSLKLSLQAEHTYTKNALYFIPWERSLYDPVLESIIRRGARDGVSGFIIFRDITDTDKLVVPTHLVEICERLKVNLLMDSTDHFSDVWIAATDWLAQGELNRFQQDQFIINQVLEWAANYRSVDDFLQTIYEKFGFGLTWSVLPSKSSRQGRIEIARKTTGYLVDKTVEQEISSSVRKLIGSLTAAMYMVSVSNPDDRVRSRNAVLQTLLNPRSDSESIITALRIGRLYADIPSRCLVFRQLEEESSFDDATTSAIMLEEVAGLLSRRGIPHCVGVYTTYSVIIVQHKPESGVSFHEIGELIYKNLRKGSWLGVSEEITVQGLPMAFQQAIEAVQVSQLLGSGPSIVYYESLGQEKLLYSLLASPVSLTMTRELLSPLTKADSRHDTKFLETLIVYMKRGRRLSETARDLHLHRNSLRYRLTQIEQILGLKLDDPSKSLLLQFAVTSYNIRKN